MKKQSNPIPQNALRPDPPPGPSRMSVTHQRMAIIFDEWLKRYAENPDEFNSTLDRDGKPVSNYGECCAHYFTKLANELDSSALLPRHSA